MSGSVDFYQMYYSAIDSNNDEYISTSDDDDESISYFSSDIECEDYQYNEQYILSHVKSAFDKFGDIEDLFLKYFIIIWYLLDIISLPPQSLMDHVIANENDGAEFWELFSIIIKNYKRYSYCNFEYKLHNIKSNLTETLDMQNKLSKYLRLPLDNSFIPRIKEMVWYYRNTHTVCKSSIEPIFKCLASIIHLE